MLAMAAEGLDVPPERPRERGERDRGLALKRYLHFIGD
jgi:hypothetical protein